MPTSISEYAFSSSLCRIREFQTDDGPRYCLTTFTCSERDHLNFPFDKYSVHNNLHFAHDEYKYIISKLYALISPQAIFPKTHDLDVQEKNVGTLNVNQLPMSNVFKIKFGNDCLTIGWVSAIGLVKTSPFTDIDVFSVNKKQFTCDSKLDICTCKACPAFKRMIDFEAAVAASFERRSPENVIISQEH